ncbi:MAG: hypothetical protein ACHQF0_10875 [Chitinophagales bacterium]
MKKGKKMTLDEQITAYAEIIVDALLKELEDPTSDLSTKLIAERKNKGMIRGKSLRPRQIKLKVKRNIT